MLAITIHLSGSWFVLWMVVPIKNTDSCLGAGEKLKLKWSSQLHLHYLVNWLKNI